MGGQFARGAFFAKIQILKLRVYHDELLIIENFEDKPLETTEFESL